MTDQTTGPARKARRTTSKAAPGAAAGRAPIGDSAPRQLTPASDRNGAQLPQGPDAGADRIDVHRGRIASAMARSITVSQGAIGSARADEVIVSQGALGGARARTVAIEKSVLGGAIAGDIRVKQGFVQSAVAREITIEQGGARAVVANHVTFGPQSGALVVIARTVDGDGRALLRLDWRGALALGAGLAVVSAALRRLVARR